MATKLSTYNSDSGLIGQKWVSPDKTASQLQIFAIWIDCTGATTGGFHLSWGNRPNLDPQTHSEP